MDKFGYHTLQAVVFCALSACGMSFKHLNYKKHSMVRLLH